jgi:hypothetical protein
MAGPKFLTNRTLIDKGNSATNQKPVLRKFQLIAEHEGFYWVKATNGNFAPEMLTFPKKDLFDYDESNASLQAHFEKSKP